MSSIYQRATATWERGSSYNRKITEAFLGSCRSSLEELYGVIYVVYMQNFPKN